MSFSSSPELCFSASLLLCVAPQAEVPIGFGVLRVPTAERTEGRYAVTQRSRRAESWVDLGISRAGCPHPPGAGTKPLERIFLI